MSEDQDHDSNRQLPPQPPGPSSSRGKGKQPMLPPLRRHASSKLSKPPSVPDYHRFAADGKMTVTTTDQDDDDVLVVQSPPLKRKFGTDHNKVALTDRSKVTKNNKPVPQTTLPSRRDKSLALITKNFFNLLMSAEDGVLDLNNAAATLEVTKRRIYDITNVLEGVGLIEKDSKNRIRWKGDNVSEPEEMNDEVTQLQAELESLTVQENTLDERIREMQESIKNLTEDDNNQKWLFVTKDDIKSVPHFQAETLIAITAPHGTALEVPDPDEAGDGAQRRYRIILKSTRGPVDIYLVSRFEEKFEDVPIASGSASIDNPEINDVDTGMEVNAQPQHAHTITFDNPEINDVDSFGGITQIASSGVSDPSSYWLYSDIDDVPLTDMWNINLDDIEWDGVDLLSDKFELPDTDASAPKPSDPPSAAPS